MQHQPQILSNFVLCDCDGVLLRFIGTPFVKYASAQLGRPLDIADWNDFDLSSWLGITPDETVALIGAFGRTPAFANLEPCKGAQDFIRRVIAAGRDPHIITASPTDSVSIERRHSNTREVFGDAISKINFVGLHESKEAKLRSYPPSIWIEDHFGNAVLGAEIGHRTFLVRDAHNRDKEGQPTPENLTWVDDLYQVADLIGI